MRDSIACANNNKVVEFYRIGLLIILGHNLLM